MVEMEERQGADRPDESGRKIFVDYEREPVPDQLGRTWLEMGLVWVGIGMCLAALMLGGVVGNGLNLKLAAHCVNLFSTYQRVVN